MVLGPNLLFNTRQPQINAIHFFFVPHRSQSIPLLSYTSSSIYLNIINLKMHNSIGTTLHQVTVYGI